MAGTSSDINRQEWTHRIRRSRIAVVETHSQTRNSNEQCRYVSLAKTGVIIYLGGRAFNILVRICLCGRYVNKEHLLSQYLIHADEFKDGAELHLDDRCQYNSIDGRLEKVCFCPRDIPIPLP
ncbi:hypothetical protein DPMN_136135 [Dreissena polymorpha]|uniref:Uncharacterized protein n=1 Tax=Dreissena polymorpha TaxID=45954 RepID=A0A9D4JHH8_DREPO|nr:hypothetical protein DPMN_136135 [Dreissena polymorpha]